MRNTIGRGAVSLGVMGILLLAATEAGAGQTFCGSTSAGWNVPNGDAVFVSGPSPVYSVLSSVGEYRSHSMLSNGPDGYVTHATSQTPPTSSDTSPYWTPFCSSCGSECWNPISTSFLQNSMPGLEQVNQGGIYTFLYGNGGENFIAYQRSYDGGSWSGASAAAVGNFAWADVGDGLGYVGTSYGYGVTYNNAQIHYGWFQYMNVQSVPQGVPGVNNGEVCSSSLAMWQHDTGGLGDVYARTYQGSTGNMNSVIGNGANALWNAVQSECSASNGWFSSFGSFFTNLGWSALCVGATGLTQGVCGQAADQMTNCFAANNCGNGNSPGSYWGSYTSHNNGTTQWMHAVETQNSVGISPDDVACWNSNGTGAPCVGAGSSIWGADGNQTVQWNSGGNNYSCWD